LDRAGSTHRDHHEWRIEPVHYRVKALYTVAQQPIISVRNRPLHRPGHPDTAVASCPPPRRARAQVTVQRSILLTQLSGIAALLASYPETPCCLPSGGCVTAPPCKPSSLPASMAALGPTAAWKVCQPPGSCRRGRFGLIGGRKLKKVGTNEGLEWGESGRGRGQRVWAVVLQIDRVWKRQAGGSAASSGEMLCE
jgi:hypothetical protein